MKDYLKMSDVFKVDVLVENSTAYTLKSELDKLYRVREVNDDTMMCSSDHVATYAAHAINSHDELVEMNKELVNVLESIENDAGQVPEFMWDMIQAAITKAKGEQQSKPNALRDGVYVAGGKE